MVQSSVFDFYAVTELARRIVTRPRDFYEQMPRQGGYSEPLIFAVVMGLISGLAAAIFSLFSSAHIGSLGFGIASILIFPLVAVAGCYIAASVMFVIWKLMGSRNDYECCFRCVAYSFVVMPAAVIAALIPYVGTLLSNIWWFWLMYLATVTVHKMESRKSLIVIGVVAVLLLFMNISGEHTQRQFEERNEEFKNQMENIQQMTPEELGEATGEFLKGLKKATEDN